MIPIFGRRSRADKIQQQLDKLAVESAKNLQQMDKLAEESSEQALRATVDLRKLAARRNLPALVGVSNAQEFVLLGFRDLSVLAHDVATSERWRKHLYARCLAVTLVALGERAKKLGGKEMSKVLKRINNGSTLISQLRTQRKQLEGLISQHDEYLRKVRNTTIAHRSERASEQIDLIENLDFNKLLRLANACQRCGNSISLLLLQISQAIANDLNRLGPDSFREA